LDTGLTEFWRTHLTIECIDIAGLLLNAMLALLTIWDLFFASHRSKSASRQKNGGSSHTVRTIGVSSDATANNRASSLASIGNGTGFSHTHRVAIAEPGIPVIDTKSMALAGLARC
jgi:hypothetical protein